MGGFGHSFLLCHNSREGASIAGALWEYFQKIHNSFAVNSPEESPFDQEVPPLYLQFGAEMLYVPGIVREGAAEVLFMHCDEPDNRSVPQLLLDCVARVKSISFMLKH